MLTPRQYSTALSGLLKLALSAWTTLSRVKPMPIMAATIDSYSVPVTSVLSADWILASGAPPVAAVEDGGVGLGAGADLQQNISSFIHQTFRPLW